MSEEFYTPNKLSLEKKAVKVLTPEEIKARGLDWKAHKTTDDQRIQEDLRAKEKLWEQVVGKQYAKQLDLNLLTIANQEAAKKVFAWSNAPKLKGMRIVGPARTGKTRVASSAIRPLVQEGKSVLRLDGQELAFFATNAHMNTEQGYEWVKKVCGHDVIFIDDFAKDFRETTARMAQMIIEKMFMQEKIMIITTQFSQKMIKEMLLFGRNSRGESIEKTENKHLVDSLNGRLTDYFETIRFT